MLPHQIELLSPARDADIGIEAVNHGADAVYIGGPSFGARTSADNRVQDIARLVRHAHRFGSRIFVTMNTILRDDELEPARKLAWQLYDAGVDALIIQDMGLLEIDLPPIQLHASTQTDIRTPEKARFLQDAGLSQIVLARELTLPQIREIHAALDADRDARLGRALNGPPYDRDATLKALSSAPRQAEWSYEVPFLAHAALEPLCATAVVYADRAEVWAPTQQPDRCRDAIAAITGLPRERCTLHVTFLGGGFGRKWETDFVRQAVTIAREVARTRPGTPVKLTWTREQDFLHDRFRPAHVARSRVGLNEEGQLLAVHSRITGPSIFTFQKRNLPPGVADPFATGLLINDFYRIPMRLADYVETQAPVPIGTWRSVAQSQNGFFAESTIDDVAAFAKRDPWALRRELCAHDPRALAVLDRVAELGEWNRPLGKGRGNASRGRGISLSIAYGSYCAEIDEVTVVGRRVTIDKIVAVFDCGLMIDPGTVDAQISGGIIFGLSAAIDGEIRFEQGAAVQRNFDSAPVLRMSQTPKIVVQLLRTDHAPGGAGEASVPGVAPALASAIHMATGARPRRLPLVADGWEFA